MAVEPKELVFGIPIVDAQGGPSTELLEVIQRLVDAIRDHETRLEALE